jgi:hypothetical protein
LFWVVQNSPDPLEDGITVRWEHIAEPVKRLDDPHRRPARPIQPARSGRFEVDDEPVEVNRAQPGVCVNPDFRRYCIGKAQLVGSRDSVRKKYPASFSILNQISTASGASLESLAVSPMKLRISDTLEIGAPNQRQPKSKFHYVRSVAVRRNQLTKSQK